jgi:hypothetical protein
VKVYKLVAGGIVLGNDRAVVVVVVAVVEAIAHS